VTPHFRGVDMLIHIHKEAALENLMALKYAFIVKTI
jgi:hypothetical protein